MSKKKYSLSSTYVLHFFTVHQRNLIPTALQKKPKNLPLVLIVFLEILRATVLIELTSISLGFNSEWHFTVATQGSLSAAMVPGCRCGYRG